MSQNRGEQGTRPFDTAQVCLNGHIVTRTFYKTPGKAEKFCRRCGESTITACDGCNAEIRGESNVGALLGPSLRACCHECGNPYPWTNRAREAAKSYAQDLQTLTPEERVQLALSIDDLVKDSPKTQVAVSRFKRLAVKAGEEAAGLFKEILVGIVSETVKKAIWP